MRSTLRKLLVLVAAFTRYFSSPYTALTWVCFLLYAYFIQHCANAGFREAEQLFWHGAGVVTEAGVKSSVLESLSVRGGAPWRWLEVLAVQSPAPVLQPFPSWVAADVDGGGAAVLSLQFVAVPGAFVAAARAATEAGRADVRRALWRAYGRCDDTLVSVASEAVDTVSREAYESFCGVLATQSSENESHRITCFSRACDPGEKPSAGCDVFLDKPPSDSVRDALSHRHVASKNADGSLVVARFTREVLQSASLSFDEAPAHVATADGLPDTRRRVPRTLLAFLDFPLPKSCDMAMHPWSCLSTALKATGATAETGANNSDDDVVVARFVRWLARHYSAKWVVLGSFADSRNATGTDAGVFPILKLNLTHLESPQPRILWVRVPHPSSEGSTHVLELLPSLQHAVFT